MSNSTMKAALLSSTAPVLPAAATAAPQPGAAETAEQTADVDPAPAEDVPGEETPAAQEAQAPAAVSAKPGRKMVRDLPMIMARIFGTPLLVDQAKLEIILGALGPRLGLGPQEMELVAKVSDDEDEDEFCNVPCDITPDGIAVISVDGTMVYKSSWLQAISGITSYGDIRGAIDKAMADVSVKGVLLCVNSLGGEVNGCFDLSDAIYNARKQKPIYGVAADNAMSGGYAILSACDRVFVSRTSGTGSIGCVCAHIDVSSADKMEGLKYTFVYSGDRKIDGNPHLPLSAAARDTMQEESDRIRMLFAATVAKYRGMTVEQVVATQAARYFGENSVSAGLADAMGTPDDALAALRAEINKISSVNIGGVPLQMSAQPLAAAAESPEPAEQTEATPETTPDATAAQLDEANEGPAAPAASAAAAAPSAEIVDLAAERHKVRGETRSQAAEIIELCALAGMSVKAAEFIRLGLTADEVRNKLQTIRADASEARSVTGHILPDAGGNDTQAAAAGWANLHAKQRGQ